MGLFGNLLNPQPQQPPTIQSMLPQVAIQQIQNGHLPTLNVDKLLLKSGEICHYADKAIYEKKTVHKHYIRHHQGVSMPGIFKGDRVHFGGGDTQVEDQPTYTCIKGYLFLTNNRVVFVGEDEGFDEKINDIVAIVPYANCVVMQFSKKEYKVFVPDGNIVNIVIRQIL